MAELPTSTITIDLSPAVSDAVRQERHHEVVCVVLRALIESSTAMTRPSLIILADEAHSVASRLYPPPREMRQ